MSRRARGLVAGIVAFAACAAPSPQEPPPGSVVPLASLASSARAWVETDELDLGEEAARGALWSGWGPNERNAEMSFVWGLGRSSKLRLAVVEPRRRLLRLRGWSFPFGDDPPLEVEVRVNGRGAGRRLLASRPGSFELEIDRELWHVGENELELVASRHDERRGELPRSAGWDLLTFDDRRTGEPELPRVATDGTVVVPHRSAIEWTLELPAQSWLVWDAVELRGGAQLVLSVRDEDGEREIETRRGAGRARLTAESGPHRLVRFSFAAFGGGGEARIRGARLHLPPPRDEPARTETAAPPAAVARPNVVIYLVDTLRADRLGCYGYSRPTSPAIDRFARDAVLWRDGRAQSSWTRPAVASILTGLHPVSHRTQDTLDRLPQEMVTLGERFSAAGWRTAMLTTNGNVAARMGFNQGWDDFVYLAERPKSRAHHVPSATVNRRVFEWLDRRRDQRPFLIVVHTSDPHHPYAPPEPFGARLAGAVDDPRLGSRAHLLALAGLSAEEASRERAAISALYDAEIAANDDSFGHLLAGLERRGLGASTAVLLLSDHGEEFFEHGGWTHGRTLYEEQLRIPFVLRLPGNAAAGRVLPGPAEQIDVVPTLLALAGIAIDPALPGRNLLDDLRGAGPRGGETQSLAWLSRSGLRLSAITRSQWKLIRYERLAGDWRKPPFELYGLGDDSSEAVDRALGAPLRRAWLEGLLTAARYRFSSALASEPAELDAELEANLRALGYL